MSEIKMSDVFNPLVIVTGRDIETWELQDINNGLYAVFYDHQACISSAKAINAYDDNQAEIAQLKAELKLAKDNHALRNAKNSGEMLKLSAQHNAVVEENNALKSQVELIKSFHDSAQFDIESLFKQQPQNRDDGSYLIDGEACFELSKAIHLTPSQCLASVKADAVKDAAKHLERVIDDYDYPDHVQVVKHFASMIINEAANGKN